MTDSNTPPDPADRPAAPRPAAELAEAADVRRVPVQRRSLERFGRLLDACAGLLDEVGYDNMTTTQVARRACVPIGTLYQFFDGKQALLRALAHRNLDLFATRMRARFAASPAVSWPEAGGAMVEEYAAMKREVPGFAAVAFGDARKGRDHLLDAQRQLADNQVVAQQIRELTLGQLGLPPAPNLDAVLTTAIEAAEAVLRLAFRFGPAGDPDLIEEAGALVRAYLAIRLPAPTPTG